MIFNIAIDMFVKAQKSRDSMPLPAPRGTESGFKLSSLSSQWPKARRAEGAGGRRQAGGGTPRGRLCLVMLSVSVCLLALKAQRWTRARVCVCLVARTQEGAWVRGGRRVGLLFEWHQQVPQSTVRSTCCIVPASLSQLHASNSIE